MYLTEPAQIALVLNHVLRDTTFFCTKEKKFVQIRLNYLPDKFKFMYMFAFHFVSLKFEFIFFTYSLVSKRTIISHHNGVLLLLRQHMCSNIACF